MRLFSKGRFSPKGLLFLGFPPKTPEVVLLKEQATKRINSCSVCSQQLRHPGSPQAGAQPPACLLLA